MRLLKLAGRLNAIGGQAAASKRPDQSAPPLVAEVALAEGMVEAAEHPTDLLAYPVLYVAACARHFAVEPWEAALLARDLSQVDTDGMGRVYRRLDADWFAWLAHRTAQARRLAEAGEVDAEQVRQVHARLRVVRAWALRHFERQGLAEAVNRGIQRDYRPPQLRLVFWRADK